jgi:ABC-type methionine transport system ATPase subunit
MQRIAVIGCSGAGKSTLARALDVLRGYEERGGRLVTLTNRGAVDRFLNDLPATRARAATDAA